ncbi:sensor histidine kinase [Microbacterium invictum]
MPIPRRRPSAAALRRDYVLAAALCVAAILSTTLGSIAGVYGEESADLAWGLVYSVALAAPIAVRRRYPEIVLVVVSVVFFAAVTLRIPDLYVCNVVVFIAMYTVGAWVDDRRRATIVRVAVIAGMFGWLLVTTFQAATTPDESTFSHAGLFSPFAAFVLIQFLINAAFFGGAYFFGERAYAQAQERMALEERTAELERERELTAAQAVALDRVRIARELHDVVAHHVSAMGVQAGAARTVVDRDPVAAKAALTVVEESARSALTELRQLLETLRTPDADAPGGSTLHLSALPELVAHAGENGLPTTLTVVGEPVPVTELVQANLYRIAQESLTNARRHGGPGATADVRLRYTDEAIELEITNTGRVPIAGRAGLGLVGMRERAAASGGTIEVGSRERGGFLVRVRLPLLAGAAAGAPRTGSRRAGAAAGTGATA